MSLVTEETKDGIQLPGTGICAAPGTPTHLRVVRNTGSNGDTPVPATKCPADGAGHRPLGSHSHLYRANTFPSAK